MLKPDLCVIGGGSAGLSVAAGAAQMGARVVLVESQAMGGECLHTGCVPSKSLLAAARAAHAHRASPIPGIAPHEPAIDFAAIRRHLHGVIGVIAPHDSRARFEGLGVTVLGEPAVFANEREVRAGATRIRARRFVLATGSRPAVPPLDGLDRVPWLTNDTLFDLERLPDHLLIVGGGPVGIEMAQAFRRLGSEVTVVQSGRCLPHDDPVLADIVLRQLEAEGVRVLEGSRATGVRRGDGGLQLMLEQKATRHTVSGSHLLLAAGRRPAVDGLGLDAAGVARDPQGVRVDARLRTTNKRIYALGDVTPGRRFTHRAGYQAGIVIRNAVLRLPARADDRALPWCTYTDPELAQTGLTEAAAREQFSGVTTQGIDLADNDRARAEGIGAGRLKLVVGARARVLGAGICAPHAGEMINLWTHAVQRGLKLKDIAGLIVPYPTLSESGKQAAGAYYTPVLYGSRMRRLVRLLQRLPG